MGGGSSAESTWAARATRPFLALATAVLFAAPAFADLTHVSVRFREAATGIAAADDLDRLQSIATALRTGIGDVAITRDGAYRVALAPALSDDAGRAALMRMRAVGGVLYAEAIDPAPVAAAVAKRDGTTPLVSRIVVKYRDRQLAADAAADRPLPEVRVAQAAARAGRPLAYGRAVNWAEAHVLTLMQAAPQDEVQAMAEAIARDPDVEWAEAEIMLYPQIAPPNDTLFQNGTQWHYLAPGIAAGAANLQAAWDVTTGWSGVRTAVVDTGSLFNHPDLAGRLIGGYDFLTPLFNANDGNGRDADPSDPGDWTANNDCGFGWIGQNSSWHGTHVAGTIGAATNNGVGVAGVNWVSRIVTARGLGKCGGGSIDIADAIFWSAGGAVAGVPANAFPARIINMSLGGGSATCPAMFQTAINGALALNTSVIVAAGNSNVDASGFSPANCSGVVTVAAVGRNGQRAPYSNFGAFVDIAAPGGAGADGANQLIWSTLNNGTTTPNPAGMTYAGYNGTSMATPHVAGIVSLIYSLKPTITPALVTNLLQTTVRPFPTGTGRDCTNNLGAVTGVVKFCGAGLVDAGAVVSLVAATGGFNGVPLLASAALAASAPNPSNFGATVTLSASVAGTDPGGTVTFTDADAPIAGCVDRPLTGAGNTKAAQCTTSALPVGLRTLRAVYSGDAMHRPADSPAIQHTVTNNTPQPTTTTLASSQNPSTQGASVTFTATVTGTAPTGTVNFRAAGVSIAGCSAVALAGAGNARTAQCATSALPAANNAISAVYSGDAGNQTSTGNLAQGVIGPNACVQFNDVVSTSPFCVHVQWMYNRSITLGCTSVEYCPDTGVSRLAMAAFMKREGEALLPFDVDRVSVENLLDLTSPKFSCFDPARNFTVTGFPRRAHLLASANVYDASASTVVTVELAYSTNGGTTWTTIPGTAASTSYATGRTPPEDRTVVLRGHLDLDVGTSYLFGLRYSSAPGAGGVSTYCAYQARIFNRNGSTPPL